MDDVEQANQMAVGLKTNMAEQLDSLKSNKEDPKVLLIHDNSIAFSFNKAMSEQILLKPKFEQHFNMTIAIENVFTDTDKSVLNDIEEKFNAILALAAIPEQAQEVEPEVKKNKPKYQQFLPKKKTRW